MTAYPNRDHRYRRTLAVLSTCALLTGFVAVLSVASTPPPAAAAPPPGGMTAEQVRDMFRGYGDAGGHWTGGDSTVSVLLPDGRVAWLFSDTFLGTVNADGTRPRDTPMVNNTIVVQDGTTLVDTRHGGTVDWPEALARPNQVGEFFWVGDAVVESGALKVLYNRYGRFGTGDLDVELKGTSLVTFALPELTVSSVVDLPVGSTTTWGSALLVDGGYTYVYGSSAAPGGLRFGHVARAPVGALGGAWQYWTGSAWSGTEAEAGRLLSGVGTAYAVQRVGTGYVLVTQEANLLFDPQFAAYTSASPTGPFTGPAYLLAAPEQQPGTNRIVYHARLHPDLARPGTLLLSYDVNSLDSDDTYADARLYRPRFVEIDWPRPAPGPVPAAPGGFTVTTDAAGVAHLGWTAVSGATGYRIWRRDVTGGQTHFVRQLWPVTTTTADVTGLITSHRYEFRVTAANAAGESAFSPTIAVTSRIVRDASVIHLANTPEAVPSSYLVRFKETPHARGDGVETFARQLVTQVGGTLKTVYDVIVGGFSATLTEAQAIDLAGHPDVLDVEQDQVVRGAAEQHDPPSWGLDRVDQRTPSLDDLYRYPNAGAGVTAYVVDSGIRITHPSFGGRAVHGTNTVDPRPVGQPAPTADDCHGHGTEVAGTIGGYDYGVAKGIQLVAVKALDCAMRGTNDSIMDGVRWAVAEAIEPENRDSRAIINLSLTMERVSRYLDEAVHDAVAKKITVVAAAGNHNSDARSYSPSRSPEAIVVGATGVNDARWTEPDRGSNYGPAVDLFAPGVNINTAGIADDPHAPVGVTATGTSIAAPHVSGAAAMVLAVHPSFTPAQVERVLVDASTKDAVLNPGAGSPNRLLFVERPPTQAPVGLTASANADGTIGLSWSAAPAHTGHYLVSQRDVTAGEDRFTRWTDPVFGTTTATARGLQEGHRYEFTVAPSNGAGTGPESNVVNATAHTDPPAAPTGLSTTANANGTITLRWTPPGPGLWYWVYQRNVSRNEADPTRLPFPLTTCCTFTAGLLDHDNEYEFTVSAVNIGGEGPRSGPARARARYPVTAAPSGLSAIAGNGEVTLRWTASPTPHVWYWIYQRNVSDEEPDFTRLPLPITTCCTMTAGLLTNDDEYEFTVTAVGPGPESGASNTVRATPQRPVPGQVTGLTATPNADGTITLRWTEPSTGGPFWFDVYQRNVTRGESLARLPLPVTACCTFTAGLLEHNEVYEFTVAATNGRAGPQSEPARATAAQARPGAPVALRGTTAGNGYVDLTWNAPGPGGFFYWVYHRNVTANQQTFTRSALPTDRTLASIGPLVHNNVYEFRVTAENRGGEGPASSTIQVTSLGGLPAAPSNLVATAGDARVTLTWTASPSPNVWYWIEYRPAGGAWQDRLLDTTCCDFTVLPLANGTTYEFRVRSTNASGDSSSATAIVAARPMPPRPLAPSGLSATAGDGRVTLTWTASPSPNVWYWIEYRPAGGAWQDRLLDTTCCDFTVLPLANGTTYEFQVRATNLAGDSVLPTNAVLARPMPPTPQPPSGLTASPGDRSVTLRWSASPTPSVYYWIEYRWSGVDWQRAQYPLSTCCAFTLSYLINGRAYEFRLRAANLTGTSIPSNVAGATPAIPPGSCRASAFRPSFIGYKDFDLPPLQFMVTQGVAYATCTGPVHSVTIRARLHSIDDGRVVGNSITWGYVGGFRDGWIDGTDTAVGPPVVYCRSYVTEARVDWTTPSGSLRSSIQYSPVVVVGDRCGQA